MTETPSNLRENAYIPGNEHLLEEIIYEAQKKGLGRFDGLDLGVGIIGAQKKFLYVNKKFQEITGYQEEELLNQSPQLLFAKEDFPKMLLNMQGVAEAEGVYLNGTPISYLRKDRGKIVCQFAGKRITIAGEPCLVGFIKDNFHIPPD